MSTPKTLTLDISRNPHITQDDISDSIGIDPGLTTAEVENIVDGKLVDYVQIANVVNDLITEDHTKALSAAQGKELKSQIDLLKADIAKIMVDGMGIAAGLGIKVTVENASTLIHIDIDEDSPLKIDENNKLCLEWNENE